MISKYYRREFEFMTTAQAYYFVTIFPEEDLNK